MLRAVQPTVRFGLMFPGTTLPAWGARCLEALVAREGVELAVRIVEDRPRAERPPDLRWSLYWRLVVTRRSRSVRPVSVPAAFEGVPAAAAADIAAIRGHELDFILRFEPGTLNGDILTAARYGVWSYSHGNERACGDGASPGREIYAGDPVTKVTLHRLTGRAGTGIVLHEGHFCTIAGSYTRHLDRIRFGGADWPARVCADIRNGNTAYLDGPPQTADDPGPARGRCPPMGRFFVKLLRNRARSHWRELWRADHWNVGIVDAPIGTFLNGGPIPPVNWLPEPPRGRFLADPFAVADDGRLFIFAEEFDYRTNLGRITVVEPRTTKPPHQVFDLKVHASYPFLFQHDGTTYCAPCISPERRGLDLFRAIDVPTQWEKVATILPEFAAQDATLFEHDGRWWLLATENAEPPNTKLHGWFAPAPAGPWVPHPLNPLKSDVRSSRPGGTPFVHDGHLYRPAQDDSTSYGAAIVLNRVVRLSPTEFEETPVARVDPVPGRYSKGLHTLSAAGTSTLIDGKRRGFASPAIRQQLGYRLRRVGRIPGRLLRFIRRVRPVKI